MKELRDRRVIAGLLRTIGPKACRAGYPVRLMEVCGTHTMAIHRYGLHALLLEAGVEMTSGPGCPVCITPEAFHRAAIGLVSRRENLVLATFGDITRVPTREGSLQTAVPAPHSRVQVVYSPEEALETARRNSDKDVVFFGAGFETTIPSIALAVKQAAAERLANFSLLDALWLIPPPLRALLESKGARIQGFLYPGHVSAVIGRKAYDFVAEEFGLPGAIAGFEPADILLAILSVLDQMIRHSPGVVNEYKRVVREEGNPRALALMDEILEVTDAVWRGLGNIPGSGLRLRGRFHDFDALKKYALKIEPAADELPGCRCGEVLRGVIRPTDCRLFAKRCTPENPVGACMVSGEGACAAYYKYH